MNRVCAYGLILFGIVIGFVLGCFRHCPQDFCGPLENGAYEIAEYDDEKFPGKELLENTVGEKIVIDDNYVTIEYDRAGGEQWKVVYRRTGETEIDNDFWTD